MRGFVHSTETFSTVDGPGLRYVVFMQGCQLRCIYCENRDTWDRHVGSTRSVEEIVRDIKRYQHYLQPHGGITVSGGEPTLQLPFVTALFSECKQMGLHTSLDTNGFVHKPGKEISALLQVTDLVLLDIKAMDNATHVALTSVNNHDPLAFAQFLDEQAQTTWIRHVVVPGYTDSAPQIAALAEFISTLRNIERVDLLAYHELGKHKWQSFADNYALEGVQPPSSEAMLKFAKILQDKGINTFV